MKATVIDNGVLSRFADQHPKPRPTHTLIVPGRSTLAVVLKALLDDGEVFTVEPSPNEPEVWHLGVFETAVASVSTAIQAAAAE